MRLLLDNNRIQLWRNGEWPVGHDIDAAAGIVIAEVLSRIDD